MSRETSKPFSAPFSEQPSKTKIISRGLRKQIARVARQKKVSQNDIASSYGLNLNQGKTADENKFY